MSNYNSNEPMLEMFIFETSQLIEQLEQIILASERSSCYSIDAINEIFRIMHTIKGSSAMMMFNDISSAAHHIEDVFYFIREEEPSDIDCYTLSDLVFDTVDFIKLEVEKIKNNDKADGDPSHLIEKIQDFLTGLEKNNDRVLSPRNKTTAKIKQQYYISQDKTKDHTYKNGFKAILYFEDGCEMENIRAYTVVHNLKDITDQINYLPEDIIDNDNCVDEIRREGFKIYCKTDLSYQEMHDFFMQTIFLKDLELIELKNEDELKQFSKEISLTLEEEPIKVPVLQASEKTEREINYTSGHQSIISVSVDKLDMLMDLVGEMVTAEAMVVQNPDLKGLELENFQKAARQPNKITSDMQNMVMSIRMVPLSTTFHKMHRIVRDMCKRLDKKVDLIIIGEETEVDKNIIEHISDPLMHLVRNALDHGIESYQDRREKGKEETGKITIEAKNAGSDVLIIIKDDGKGLNRGQILEKARENNMIHKAEEDLSDREVYNLITLPGFSTKHDVSEFSGRGVGMDVVTKNIEAVGGSVSVDSIPGNGTIITLKIPLTLAIIDGMNIKVGDSCYTLPTVAIKESFRPEEGAVFTYPDRNEMIMVRGECHSILRLHELYKIESDITNIYEGIIIMVEHDEKTLCIFADELLGQQQVVVKTLPDYIINLKRTKGLAGCTLLGDGSISLILDVSGLIHN